MLGGPKTMLTFSFIYVSAQQKVGPTFHELAVQLTSGNPIWAWTGMTCLVREMTCKLGGRVSGPLLLVNGAIAKFIGIISLQLPLIGVMTPFITSAGPPCTSWDGFCWCHPLGIRDRWLCNYVDRGPFLGFLVWPWFFFYGVTLRPQSFKVLHILWEMSYTVIQIIMHVVQLILTVIQIPP